jgi:CheY-like chemotaxis protein
MQIASAILVVDKDSEGTIPDLREREGYSIVAVETGQEALAQVHQRSYDLILLDGNQPDKGALSLLIS